MRSSEQRPRIEAAWPGKPAERYVVFTGGEPLLQLDTALLEAVHAYGFEVAVETNSTLETPLGLDWITVSPKAGAPWRLRAGPELKLVYPQAGLRSWTRCQKISVSPNTGCTRWTGRMGGQHGGDGRLLPRPPQLAAEPADAQADRNPLRFLSGSSVVGWGSCHQGCNKELVSE